MKTIKLNGKPVEFLVTAAFDGKYSLELGTSNYIPYVKLAEKALSMFP